MALAFHYFVLTAFWSEGLCILNWVDQNQCGICHEIPSLYIHGLWPTTHALPYPSWCQNETNLLYNASKLSPELCEKLSLFWPDCFSDGSIYEHEFNKHGLCAQYNATNYFSLTIDLFHKYFISNELQNTLSALSLTNKTHSKATIMERIGSEYFINCQSNMLFEIRIALDKAFNIIKPFPLNASALANGCSDDGILLLKPLEQESDSIIQQYLFNNIQMTLWINALIITAIFAILVIIFQLFQRKPQFRHYLDMR
eukprot:1085065_1